MITAYLAADEFEPALDEELRRRGVRVEATLGRLRITHDAAIDATWAVNTWFDAEELTVTSKRSCSRSEPLPRPSHRHRPAEDSRLRGEPPPPYLVGGGV